MRVINGFFVLMGLVLIMSGATFGQVCGDISGDNSVDLLDMSWFMAYGAGLSPTPPNMSMGELDGRNNISFSDWVSLANYLFADFQDLTCNAPTLEYSFTPSLTDTLFIPRVLFIPENVQSVTLPFMSSCADSVDGLLLPTIYNGVGSTANFGYSEFVKIPVYNTIDASPVTIDPGDTAQIYVWVLHHGMLKGRHTIFSLKYNRTAPGAAAIVPQLFDRHPLWRTSVENQKDLYIPVIVYYDYVIPPDTMQVTPTATAMTSYAHRKSKDSVAITYTSSPNPVKFTLSASENWVMYPTGTLTTPATVYLRANADSLSAGEYAATLNVSTTDPNTTIACGPVAVSLTVLPPIEFPIGDFDCSGGIDVADLTIMIAYMFLGGDPPTPCY